LLNVYVKLLTLLSCLQWWAECIESTSPTRNRKAAVFWYIALAVKWQICVNVCVMCRIFLTEQ